MDEEEDGGRDLANLSSRSGRGAVRLALTWAALASAGAAKTFVSQPGVNSQETNRHLSGPIDFHMKSKYIHSVCTACHAKRSFSSLASCRPSNLYI